MYQFSEIALGALYRAGWKEGYRVDSQRYEREFKANGYTVLPIALEFLSNFGELGIYVPLPTHSHIGHGFHTRANEVTRNFSPDRIEGYSEILHDPLCVIGYDSGESILAMNPAGKVYGLYEYIIFLAGNSGEEAIEGYCTFKKFPRVFDDKLKFYE